MRSSMQGVRLVFGPIQLDPCLHITRIAGGDSAWLMHNRGGSFSQGTGFHVEPLCISCRGSLSCQPSPNSHLGPFLVFLGYELHPAAKWGGDNLVAKLIRFEGIDFRTARVGDNVVHAHRIEEVIVEMGDKVRSHLQAKCDRMFLEVRPPDDRTPDRCAPVGDIADLSTNNTPAGLPRGSPPGRPTVLRRWILARCLTVVK